MYDTSPLFLPKGETKPFLHVEIDNKTLESLFDLHPSLETSFDLTDLVASATGESSHSPPVRSVVTASVASSAADLPTLSSADTSQHLAELERRPEISVVVSAASYTSQTPSVIPRGGNSSPTQQPQHHHHPHHHHLHQQPPAAQQLQGYHQQLSPSLTTDDVSQALSDDSCVFMPEYEQLAISTAHTTTTSGGWGAEPFYSTVKTEDLELTACSLEATLPGFSTSAASSMPEASGEDCKMDVSALRLDTGGHYSLRGGACGPAHSPAHSMRSLSESSTATTTAPDSPCRSKGGSRRRQVPKGSAEYKEKRARNNVAVRKSRAKAKEKQRMTETRVRELTDQNDQLQKKVEMLTKELTVLRGLFVNVGASLPADFTKLLDQAS